MFSQGGTGFSVQRVERYVPVGRIDLQRIRSGIRFLWVILRVYYIALRFEWGIKLTFYKWELGLRLYAHGITRYSSDISYIVFGSLSNGLSASVSSRTLLTGPAYVYHLVTTWVAENLVNPAQFFTEALVLLIVELPILYLVSRQLQVNPSRPWQDFRSTPQDQLENKDGSLILGLNVTNVGEVAAVSCEARLTFELKSGDLVHSTKSRSSLWIHSDHL